MYKNKTEDVYKMSIGCLAATKKCLISVIIGLSQNTKIIQTS